MSAKTTLQQALQQNTHLLSRNFSNIGRSGNTYLSHSENGWGVVRPNLCQRWHISRHKADYPHLHLRNVAWHIYLTADAPPALKARVLRAWDRYTARLGTYPIAVLDEQPEKIAPNLSPNCRNVQIGNTLITLEVVQLTQLQGVKAIAYGNTCFCDDGNSTVGHEVFTAGGPALQDAVDHLPYANHFMHIANDHVEITTSGNLAEHGILRVVHASAPVFSYSDQEGSNRRLQATYKNALTDAALYGIRSIGFSLLSPVNFGWDPGVSAKIAFEAIEQHVSSNKDDLNVIRVVVNGYEVEEAFQAFDGMRHLGVVIEGEQPTDTIYVGDTGPRERGARGPLGDAGDQKR